MQPAASEIYVTVELANRAQREADYRLEKIALQHLANELLSPNADVLPRFVDVAMKLTRGVAAGLSLYEEQPSPGIFRWRNLQGSLAKFEGSTTPRDYSPCGVTMDQNRPVLTRHSERYYKWISDANIELPEVLLVPLSIGVGEPMGTLWIVSDEEGHFNSGDARAASELAAFVGIALLLKERRERLESSLGEQETLTHEMSHRIKNLFAIAEGLVRVSAKTTETKDEMAETLIGRFQALASAHGLIRQSFGPESGIPRVSDLQELILAVAKPHESKSARRRFFADGPAITLGQHAINGVALIFHELATNAAKHGALRTEAGEVSVIWDVKEDELAVEWSERGGPEVAHRPVGAGFGDKLLNDTVRRQFGGRLEQDWGINGLRVVLALPTRHLAQ